MHDDFAVEYERHVQRKPTLALLARLAAEHPEAETIGNVRYAEVASVKEPPAEPEPPRVEAPRRLRHPVRSRQVLDDVAAAHGVTVDDIKGTRRWKKVVRARQHAMAALLDIGPSLGWVGRQVNRDHTTVLHGARQHRRRTDGQS